MSTLSDDDLQRYSRQILMPEFDIAGQQALAKGRVLVVGAGGLGCPIVLYLAAAGVGHIHVIDDDRVELANLQRQIAFTMDDLDKPKATALANRARALNPSTNITSETARADPQWLGLNLGEYDLVLDATDNFDTRFAINQASVASGVPWSPAPPSAPKARSPSSTPETKTPLLPMPLRGSGRSHPELLRNRRPRLPGRHDRHHPGHGSHQTPGPSRRPANRPPPHPRRLAHALARNENPTGPPMQSLR